MRPHDKTAIVSGGGAGIGRATALRFAGEGAWIVVSDRDEILRCLGTEDND